LGRTPESGADDEIPKTPPFADGETPKPARKAAVKEKPVRKRSPKVTEEGQNQDGPSPPKRSGSAIGQFEQKYSLIRTETTLQSMTS
jgi:hypothetical protein